MGKAGKARKRQRLEGLSDAIVAVTPLAEPSTINEEQLAISISMLELLSNDT